MNKIQILLYSIWGELIKLSYLLKLRQIYNGINYEEKRREKIIISLTSYGRRVSKILPYTIYSLLRQTYKPDLIILWLDNEHWNEESLPKSILRLKKYGLTVEYYNDIKSYKKLIPTLKKYPNDIIITCDDDLYYDKNMIELLIEAYRKSPSCIYTHRAHRITFDSKGALKRYNDWDDEISNERGKQVFLTGGAGCLYKKDLLYKDILKEDLFMNLSPKADDVWFYFMCILQKTEIVVLPHKNNIYIPLDNFYQYFHKGAALSQSNCKESLNDKQIKAIMDHYKIKDIDLH